MNIKEKIRKIFLSKNKTDNQVQKNDKSNNKKTYRLHYINYHNIGSSYGMHNMRGIIDWPFKPFTLPKNMTDKEAYKILSYLTDFIEHNPEIEPFSLNFLKTLDSVIDLERFGFKRLDYEPKEELIIDLFTITGRTKRFKTSKYYTKYFEWYTPKVKKEEVEKIYQKYGMEFRNIEFIDEFKEPEVVIKRGMKIFEKESDIIKEKINYSNNPLKTIPESTIQLYAFAGTDNNIFFDTKEDLEEYKNKNQGYSLTIDYLGKMAGRNDVIRISYNNGTTLYYSVIDSDGYAVYSERKSIKEGKYIWEYEYGDLKDIYNELTKRGIELENDIYKKESELYQSFDEHIKKILKEKNK